MKFEDIDFKAFREKIKMDTEVRELAEATISMLVIKYKMTETENLMLKAMVKGLHSKGVSKGIEIVKEEIDKITKKDMQN